MHESPHSKPKTQKSDFGFWFPRANVSVQNPKPKKFWASDSGACRFHMGPILDYLFFLMYYTRPEKYQLTENPLPQKRKTFILSVQGPPSHNPFSVIKYPTVVGIDKIPTGPTPNTATFRSDWPTGRQKNILENIFLRQLFRKNWKKCFFSYFFLVGEIILSKFPINFRSGCTT